jgi:high-affinity nickel-transport protein
VTGLAAVLALGFVLGMRHATDPDHVIAVTTILSRHRSTRRAAVVGAVWGLGHTLTILVVGGGIVLFGWVIPPRVGLSMELAVGVMLVILGITSLRGVARGAREAVVAARDGAHAHAHAHGDYVHTHVHAHDPERHPHRPDDTPIARLDRFLASERWYHVVRPLLVGVVHGLAGSAAVALLVVPAIGGSVLAVWYLLVFGGGTIAGMTLVTVAVSVPFAATSSVRWTGMHRALRMVTGVASVAFGLFIAYEIVTGGGWMGGA